MLKVLIGRLIRKYGMKKLLIMIGDIAVKYSKTKEDDKIWAQVKKILNKF
jgi:hypothetical protein